MADETFGGRLAAARMKKGLSIDQVSGALRIRSSILEALEDCDFTHMPLKGYSRNMVSSYARYVGLNSTELTEQFLREYHEFERLKERAEAQGSYASVDTLYQSPSSSRQYAGGKRETVSVSSRNKSHRSYWTTEEPDSLNRSASPNSFRPQTNKRNEKRKGVSQNSSVRNTHYSSHKTQRGLLSPLLAHPVMLIVVLVIVLLAILIGWALLANTCSKTNPELLPVTGASAPSTQDGVDTPDINTNTGDIQALAEEEARYGPFELRIAVTEGTSWLTIVIDGNTEVAEMCSSPWERTYMVASSAQIQAGAPGGVKVYRNDVEVMFDMSAGVGELDLKVELKPIQGTATLSDPDVPNAQIGR